MPIEVNWLDNSQSVIYMIVSDPWTWNDFFTASRQALTLAQNTTHEVHFVADFTNAKQFPRGISLQRIRNVLDFKHPNLGILTIFGANPFMRVMLNTVLTAIGKVHAGAIVVETLEDALQVVEKHRAVAHGRMLR